MDMHMGMVAEVQDKISKLSRWDDPGSETGLQPYDQWCVEFPSTAKLCEERNHYKEAAAHRGDDSE